MVYRGAALVACRGEEEGVDNSISESTEDALELEEDNVLTFKLVFVRAGREGVAVVLLLLLLALLSCANKCESRP